MGWRKSGINKPQRRKKLPKIRRTNKMVGPTSALSDLTAPLMVRIPGGVFVMGSDHGQENEKPPHKVVLSPYFLARYAVTNREYARFLRATSTATAPSWDDPKFNHPDQPVVTVSWFDAMEYCNWLSRHLGRLFRLPTEAEREMACRAGTTTAYPWGESPERNLADYGKRWSVESPEVVGGPPNAFELCNMADNIHEWCLDWYQADYYRISPEKNPQGPDSGFRRASRGGAWRHQVKVTRSTARSSLPPHFRYTDYGFRLARSA